MDIHRLPSTEGLILLLKNTAIRQQLLSHPVIVSTLVQRAEQRSGLSCADVEERLAAVIDAEVSGTGRADEQATIFSHVHACPWCYDIYALTHEIIDAQNAGALPHWPR